MAAKFVLEKDPAGQFRFRLMSQGRVLSSSGAYSTKRAAQNAIASVQATAPGAKIDDTTQASTPNVAKVAAKKVAKALDSVVKTPRRRGSSTAEALVAAAVPSTRRSAAATGPGRTATAKAGAPTATSTKRASTKRTATKAPAAKATATATKAPTTKAPATKAARGRRRTTTTPSATAAATVAAVRAPRKARKA